MTVEIVNKMFIVLEDLTKDELLWFCSTLLLEVKVLKTALREPPTDIMIKASIIRTSPYVCKDCGRPKSKKYPCRVCNADWWETVLEKRRITRNFRNQKKEEKKFKELKYCLIAI